MPAASSPLADQNISPSILRRAWWAVVVRFLVHGLVTASWISRIPAIKDALRLDNGVFGVTLLGTALGSLVAIPVTGWLIHRFGSNRLSILTSAGYSIALLGPALAVNAWSLFGALFLFGIAAASNDVSMNAQGVSVENALKQPTMSRFHAMFSIGGMAGAAVGGLVAERHVPPAIHLGGMMLFLLLLCLGTFRLADPLPETENTSGTTHRLGLRSMPAALLALSTIGFCMFLSEGAMADWTAIFLRQILRTGPGVAAAGYAVFSATMAIFRLAGDWITAKLGSARTVQAGSLAAAAGVALALLAPTPVVALTGFAVAGCGFSVIVPLVFAAGGRVPGVSSGVGIATVSGIGYLGFLVGPPTIGFLSQLTSLRVALWLVVVLSVLSAGLSRFAGSATQGVHTTPDIA